MNKNKQMIKSAWIKQMQEKEGEEILDLYYQSMTKIAIILLNRVSDKLVFNSLCLKGNHLTNQVIDHMTREYSELYRYGYISYEETCHLLNRCNNDELLYFFVRMLYPSFYYENNMCIDLFTYQTQLSSIIAYLKTIIDFAVIIY